MFATKGIDKFKALRWRTALSGMPIVDGVVAWIDCDLWRVDDVGDHLIVIGLVRELDVESSSLPLLFFQGGYGRFTPSSMASGDPRLGRELRFVDYARPEMERVASNLDGRCVAVAYVEDNIVVMAGTGQPRGSAPEFIGGHTPAVPALATLFMAYADQPTVERWLSHAESAEDRETLRRRLAEVRARGYSVGLKGPEHAQVERMLREGRFASASALSDEDKRKVRAVPYDPLGFTVGRFAELRSVSVPVFGPDGHVMLSLNFFPGARKWNSADAVSTSVEKLLQAANRVTTTAGGRHPD